MIIMTIVCILVDQIAVRDKTFYLLRKKIKDFGTRKVK